MNYKSYLQSLYLQKATLKTAITSGMSCATLDPEMKLVHMLGFVEFQITLTNKLIESENYEQFEKTN